MSDLAPSPSPVPGPSTRAARSDGLAPRLAGIAGFLAAVLFGYGLYVYIRTNDFTVAGLGGLALVAALSAAAVVAAVRAGRPADVAPTQATQAGVEVRELLGLVRAIERNSRISERGKQVAYREHDREVIRRAIEEDVSRGDFAGARQLADEFEQSFGYKLEAERFRDEIQRRVEDARGHEIGEATTRVDTLCDGEHWSDAFAEAGRLISKYDGEMRVRLLRTKVEERRQQRKVALVNEFREAHGRGDADSGSELLRRLDAYLTPDEGRQLEAEAREVFQDRKMKLRERYTRAVQDRDYSEALRIGGIIRRDYPNSTLAKEAAAHEGQLRDKAGIAPEEEPAPI